MKKIKIELKWGIIFSVFMLFWMTMEMMTGLHGEHIDQHAIYTNFIAIPAILMYVLALKDKKKNFYDGKMSFGQGFASSIMMTVVITSLSPLCLYISMSFISPDYFTNAIEFSVSNDYLTQKAADKYFNLSSYMTQSIVGSLIMGILTGAIVNIFMRTKAQ